MAHISKEEYEIELAKIKADNASKERKRKLEEEKEKGKVKREFKAPSMSKLMLFGIVALCLEITLFAQYAMIKLQDASAMYALIGIPAAAVAAYLGYIFKSRAENTVGGIVFETAMLEKKQQMQTVQTHVDVSVNVEDEEVKG